MKFNFTQIKQWIIATIVAALAMNFMLSFYNRAAGWIDRTAGSTTAIYNPNSSLLYGTEGRGHHSIDSRGYVNDTDILADNYIITIGASFTQGKEVERGQRYTDLLNSWLGYTDEAYVYNVSQDGYYLPQIVKGYSALLKEFPDSSKIIIEIGSTNYTNEQLENALVQRPFDEMQTGENILSTLSWKKKMSIYVKEYSPLIYNVNKKIASIKELNNNNVSSQEELDFDEYKKNIDNIFEFLTSNYDGELIVLYHPKVNIEDGELVIENEDTENIFKNSCSKYNVTCVDMSDKFKQEYYENYELPYGFSNTAFGQGHFNVAGHRMIAEELIEYLED